MANSDAIIGLIDEVSGRHFIMDTWLKDHVMPEIDQHQSTELTWGKRENGTTTVRFRRKRITGDQQDFQFTDDSCAYFFFPTQGGSFNAISKRMHKHETIPNVSKQRICIKSCTKSSTPDKTTTMTPTTTVSGQDAAINEQPSQALPTSQPEWSSDTSSSPTSQAPNLFLHSPSSTISSSTVSSGAPSAPATSAHPSSTTSSTTTMAPAAPPEKSLDATSTINLSPSNDLSAELDNSSTLSTSASSNQHTTSPFNKLAFLSEPSLRWLAGIGCVATLLAMIVFQACFTVYKNKQAYKQNLYRQSAFKQNTYLHGAYITDAHHQPSTGSEETQTASLRNSVNKAHSATAAATAGQSAPAPLSNRSHPHQQHRRHVPFHVHQQQVGAPFGGVPVQQVRGAGYNEFATPSPTESSEQEEEDEDEEELEDGVVDEEEEEYEDDMMMDNSFDYHHQRTFHGHHRHPYHGHQVHHPHHASQSSPHHHPANSAHQHSYRQHRGHSHYRAPAHYPGHHHQHPAAMQHHAGHSMAHANLHRAHLPSRSQPNHQMGGHPAHQPQRPDSYFLPSQRRY